MRRLTSVGCLFALWLTVGCVGDDELDDLKPDLLVTEIKAPEWIETGDSAPIAVTVWNRGMVAAQAPFTVMIESSWDPGFSILEGYWIWDETVDIPGRASRTYSTYWSEAFPGQIYFRATADSIGYVQESVEDNNSSTTTMHVLAPFEWPDLTVAITLWPTNVEVNTDFWLGYTVSNIGDATSPATLVGIRAMQPFGVSTGWWSATVFPSLAAGESYSDMVLLNLTAPLVPTKPGMIYVVVGVDYAGTIVEWDETNNADEAAVWAW